MESLPKLVNIRAGAIFLVCCVRLESVTQKVQNGNLLGHVSLFYFTKQYRLQNISLTC